MTATTPPSWVFWPPLLPPVTCDRGTMLSPSIIAIFARSGSNGALFCGSVKSVVVAVVGVGRHRSSADAGPVLRAQRVVDDQEAQRRRHALRVRLDPAQDRRQQDRRAARAAKEGPPGNLVRAHCAPPERARVKDAAATL